MKAAKGTRIEPLQADLVPTYEQLMHFNQHLAGALALIEEFGRKRLIPQMDCRYFRALLQEVRAAASQTVIEYIDQQEMTNATKASKARLKLEKQMLK